MKTNRLIKVLNEYTKHDEIPVDSVVRIHINGDIHNASELIIDKDGDVILTI